MGVEPGCPAEAELSRFVIRALPATMAAGVESHLADCADCRTLVFALATGTGGAASIADAPAGERVGRFEMIDLIGRGAMGAVYRARDPELDRTVAIKLRHVQSRLDVEQEDRLRREAQALARLADPNVVGVFEAGVAEGKPFVAMEYVAGETLERWMETRHEAPAVLAMLVQAGRGLAAAHAVGLVHRDFKPSNVLVSTAGVAKVGDFGLVRLDGEATPHAQVDLDAAMVLTMTGTLLGTPAYMAPEQLDGHAATEASDQFSFCVTLYEALYGTRPFAGATIEQLRAAMARTLALPATPRLPPPIRAGLLRGLAVDPAKRHASMSTLVSLLERRPARVLPWVLAATALLGVAAVVVGMQMRGGTSDPCAGADAALAGTWDAPTKAAIKATLLASGVPYAADAWRGVETALDGYASSWTQARRAACEATRVHGEQSEQVLALREQCLDNRVREMQLLTASLATADAKLVSRSVQVARRLSPVGPCADVRTLVESAPPSSPISQVRLDQLRGDIARGKNQSSLGKLKDSIALLDGVIAAAHREGYPGLEAEAMIDQGRLKFLVDGDAKKAEKQLKQALLAADRGHDDYLRARAATILLFLVGAQMRFDDAEEIYQQGLATFGRLVGAETIEAQLLGNRGQQLTLQGKLAEAEPLLRKTLAVMVRTQGPDHPEIAVALAALSELLMRKGASKEGYELAVRSYEMDERIYGPHHPETAKSLFNVANALSDQGKYDEAAEKITKVIAILEAALGPDHIDLANAVDQLGVVRRHQDRLEDALVLHKRSLALREKTLGPDAFETGISLDNIGLALGLLERPAEALPYHQRALAITEATIGPESGEAGASHGYLGATLRSIDKPREAIAEFKIALALTEKELGPEHSDLSFYLSGIGHSYLDLHKPKHALPYLERSLKLRDPEGDPESTAAVQFALARALWGSGGDKVRARELAERAKPGVSKKDLRAVVAWLATPQ